MDGNGKLVAFFRKMPKGRNPMRVSPLGGFGWWEKTLQWAKSSRMETARNTGQGIWIENLRIRSKDEEGPQKP